MTTKEMMKARLKPGYWFENIAPLGEKPIWKKTVAPLPETDTLFGYETRAFLAKQYK